MRYLKFEVRGPDVEAWANFLRGIRPCSELLVTDTFTSEMIAETKLFQRSVGQVPDGIVGPKTMAEAMKLGYDPMTDEGGTEEDGPNWPPRPDFGPLSYPNRAAAFGQFAYVPAPTANNPEGIKITDNWSAKNISRVVIPQLVGVTGAPKSGKIYFHTAAVEQLKGMFQAWDDAGLTYLIKGDAGSWVPRFIRGSRSALSNHAWGTAFDINVPWNYLGAQPALKGTRGSVRELVPIANEYGFYWGGHFSRRPDGMHFEVARIL
jgi:hypothetical protein